MSNFNYCPLVWHFCGEGNTKKLEKIQERALRFIYNDSQTAPMKIYLKNHSYIHYKQTPVYLHDLVTIKKSSNTLLDTTTLSTYQELTPPGMVCIH